MSWSRRIATSEEISVEPPEPDEPAVVCKCSVCKCEIYSNEIYGMDDMGDSVCRDCLEEEWSKLADDEKFELLGYEVII